jgi:nucleoid DNA-binding protein
MNKKEFIQFHAKQRKIQLNDAETEVNGVLDSIMAALKQDGSVKLTGVMSFRVNVRPAGTARNPKTGETVETEERRTVSFSSGKLLKDAVNTPAKKAEKKAAAPAKKAVVAKKKAVIKKK